MIAEHTARKHALLSASSAARWLACPPSAKLCEQFPDTASEAAAEGTLAHELAELKLRHYFQTVEFGKQKYTRAVNKLKKDALWKDEMDRYTEGYLDYIKETALALPAKPSVRIEERVDFGTYTHTGDGSVEGTGIADCVLLYGQTVHVIDFKYGQGVPVSAEKNPQLLLYALGAYESFRMLYPIQSVRLSIYQPRVSEGASEWMCTAEELLEFGAYVKERAALAWEGRGEFSPGESTCRFCRAKARCRARADKNVELAFRTMKRPPLISPEEAGDYLKKGEDVARWLKDLQEWALAECLAGRTVPGWKAVEGRSSREWSDMDEAFEILQAGGTPEALLWEKKPLTLAQIEKAIGKKEFGEMVGSLVIRKPGKPALVKESDKREAIMNRTTAKEAFKEEIK